MRKNGIPHQQFHRNIFRNSHIPAGQGWSGPSPQTSEPKLPSCPVAASLAIMASFELYEPWYAPQNLQIPRGTPLEPRRIPPEFLWIGAYPQERILHIDCPWMSWSLGYLTKWSIDAASNPPSAGRICKCSLCTPHTSCKVWEGTYGVPEVVDPDIDPRIISLHYKDSHKMASMSRKVWETSF